MVIQGWLYTYTLVITTGLTQYFNFLRKLWRKIDFHHRVWSDMGIENVHIARFMLHNRGWNCKTMLVGSSVLNQCIKRLWLDVKRLVVCRFESIFYSMDENDLLDSLNDLHLYVLHLIFLPSINNGLRELLEDWNNHPLSSEHNFFLRISYGALV